MLRSAIPTRFQLAWGQNAAGAFIRTVPVTSQIGIQNGAASYNDGFVPDNFTPTAAGGVPPFGQDMNGVLNETTTWDVWYQAGGPIPFDATFASAHGGYPLGAIVDSLVLPGAQWCSLAENNTTDPDDPLTSTNWERYGIPVGAPTPVLTSSVQPGFIPMNGLTIGNSSSNATAFANGAALFLFVFNWTNFSNTQCPILTSAGAPTTRGVNAVADFNANKQLTMPNAKGLGVIGVDTMGGAASTFLNGVPVTIGNTTTPGSILGENLHTLTAAEAPTITAAGAAVGVSGTVAAGVSLAGTVASGISVGGTVASGISVSGTVASGIPFTGNTTVGDVDQGFNPVNVQTGATAINSVAVKATIGVSGSTTATGAVTASTTGTGAVTASTTGTGSVSGSTTGTGAVSGTTGGLATTSNNTGNGSHNTTERNMTVFWVQKL